MLEVLELVCHKGWNQVIPSEAVLYGEDGARAVVTCEPGRTAELVALATLLDVPTEPAGTVGVPTGPLEIHLGNSHLTFGWPTPELRRIYLDAIPRRMGANTARPAGGS